MFTGIVQAAGRLAASERTGGDCRLTIAAEGLDLGAVRIGDSIAVNGVCLTAVTVAPPHFAADVSVETLERTTLGRLGQGDRVNLETALTLATPLGGHLVSGHVDGVGEVRAREPDGRSERWRFRAPARLARYIAEKGSICVDGVSLTVNGVNGAEFDVNIVPHTATVTTLGDYGPGQPVNLEVDLIARYLERLMLGDRAADPDATGVTRDLLRRAGFEGSDTAGD
ncbi:riboflavin synthase [Sediminicurvatus halobius]|uniref:Riboflavin synthase n=1 Tax=Sediminicurvatus halobius TaxID=2182432 RepID=A0A2U2MZA3_9GAMM|nr:riboflavin synthase [Spiribacter halobius]PWG62142.1 riboflavin synthase [Spiribacter halobius]UEX77172.1 riboflavin synthase [Spiribacter halobius]